MKMNEIMMDLFLIWGDISIPVAISISISIWDFRADRQQTSGKQNQGFLDLQFESAP